MTSVRTRAIRALVAGTTILGLALVSTPASAATPKAGASCSKHGARVHVATGDLQCKRKGAKWIWREVGGNGGQSVQADPVEKLSDQEQIPKVIQNLGFDLQPYDAATGRAGAMQIVGVTTPVFPNEPAQTAAYRNTVNIYGSGSSDGLEPQISFVLPLGTPVISPVTGIVCERITLYSGDTSLRIAPTGIPCVRGRASVLIETEHVIEPLVAAGEKVTAGQRIATVSDYTRWWREKGFGIVELGVAITRMNDQGMAWHSCPMLSLDPGKAAGITSALASALTAWNNQLGAPQVFDLAKQNPTGCLTQDWVGDRNSGRA